MSREFQKKVEAHELAKQQSVIQLRADCMKDLAELEQRLIAKTREELASFRAGLRPTLLGSESVCPPPDNFSP